MNKDLWIIEHETIGDEYAAGDIERDEAAARLQTLGFDPGEIKDQLDELDLDRDAVA